MTSKEIREKFLKFFEDKNHEIVASAPVVVKNDPTLMFTNAGMNQFKSYILGEEQPKNSRVVDTQRCLRVSGKHNDLEEVGIDTYHHTFFEMLGNWSFGDYFKKEAIAWSWELLTEVFQLDKDRMYVSIFEGNAEDGLEKDQEAFDFWKEHISEDRILLGSKEDNFWEMGDTGPCGPCSEIHYDMRPDQERAEVSGASLVNADHEQVIEIWNLVFMQFNRKHDKTLELLPQQHVDTGMGFERLVRVVQGKMSNYDTDVFQPIIQFIAQKSGIKYGDNEQTDIAMRVLADHARAVAFTIADGQLPSNNRAGYVIRRILRRAVRYAYTFLNFKEPFLNELIGLIAEQFEGVFDVLHNQKGFVQKVVLEEEVSFLRTLTSGIERFESYTSDHKDISGDFAFELFDTFGFPIDLTQLLAREKGINVDMEGFHKALKVQKDRSRAATAMDLGDWISVHPDQDTEFVGYDQTETSTQIIKYRKVIAKKKEYFQLLLTETPFYAESGGQIGDVGFLIGENGEKIKITDTKKENHLIVHFTEELPNDLKQNFTAKIDVDKRKDTERNHSATHLMHSALRHVLGDHIQQKGSLVTAGELRFDFSHFSKLSHDEILKVEDIVNEKIRQNIPLTEERSVPYAEAIERGVTALFDEKYGDTVRVVTFDDGFSKELCGGTHVKGTGELGFFKIVSESSVAAGVRRIEAVTGTRAAALIREQFELVNHIKELLNNPKDFVAAVDKIIEENSELRKEATDMIKKKAQALRDEFLKKTKEINGIDFLSVKVELPHIDAIKTLAHTMKSGKSNLFLLLGAVIDGKPSLTLAISDELAKERDLNAGKIVRELAKDIKGGGGGQPFFATAGGKDAAGLDIALAKAEEFVKEK